MKIAINAVLYHEKPRGVGRYVNNMLKALAQKDSINEYFVFYGPWMVGYDFLSVEQNNFYFIPLHIPRGKILRNLYLAFLLPLKLIKYKPDFLHLIDTNPIFIKTCKIISSIHDLAEFEVSEKYSPMQAFCRKVYVKYQIRLSDLIMSESVYTRKDIIKRFHVEESKTFVVPNLLSKKIICPSEGEPENYFLFVSEIERTKNLGCLVDAFSMLPTDIKDNFEIYVVGKPGNDYKNVMKVVNEKQLSDRVKFWGYVDDDGLAKLYAKSYAFVFPSLFEGFGLPVLEAMGNGIPVICSNVTSIPEVGGDAVITFNPYDSSSLKKALTDIVITKGLREQLISKGLERSKLFTADNAAEKTLQVYEKMKEICG